MQTKMLQKNPDYIAPDGSKIFLLPETKRGGICLCELPPDSVSKAVCHKTVEEIWFFISGKGFVWRKPAEAENGTIEKIQKNMALTIPHGCHFQFKNTGKRSLRFLITTMPPWPGAHEAFEVQGHWEQ